MQGKVIPAKEKLELALEAHATRIHLVQEAEKERKALAKPSSEQSLIVLLQYLQPCQQASKSSALGYEFKNRRLMGRG